MSIVSKEKSCVEEDYEASDELILQAVKELAPRWALYDRELEFFQWAWEFLRRNPDYRRLAIEALHALDEWHKNKNDEKLTRFLSLAEEISNKYGLVVPLHPDEEITAENRWNEKLNGKYWSQAKVKAGTIGPGKIFIKLESHERVLIVDLNTPRQTYNSGHVAAIQYHLEDMRRLVFEAPPTITSDYTVRTPDLIRRLKPEGE